MSTLELFYLLIMNYLLWWKLAPVKNLLFVLLILNLLNSNTLLYMWPQLFMEEGITEIYF